MLQKEIVEKSKENDGSLRFLDVTWVSVIIITVKIRNASNFEASSSFTPGSDSTEEKQGLV